MTTPNRPALNADNPWPGLDPFDEEDRKYFHGREDEISELLRLVRREPLTVLFGRSGLGKTSLLRAGLFPLLRDEDHLPVYVRLDHTASTRPLRDQVLAALQAACAAETVEATPPVPEEELWSFFHRRATEFWSARSRPITPVLVLDQFEEIFTLGGDREVAARSASFLAELADLIEGRPPESVKQALEGDSSASARFDFKRAAVKLVLSFREDFLAQMEGLKRQMPSLMHNRYRLLAMSGAQAYAVITNAGGHLVDDEIARRIIRLAWSNEPDPPVDRSEFAEIEIDPALLSVVCSELNHKRLQARPPLARITSALLEGADREILTGFYERSMAGLDPRVRTFVEDELITDRGFRDSHAFDDALALPGVGREAIDALIARRLLRVDERGGVRRLELTHDVLTRVVRESRDTRRAREAEAAAEAREQAALEQQRRNRRNAVFVGAGALLAVVLIAVTGLFAWQAGLERKRASTMAGEAYQQHVRAEEATAKAKDEQGKAAAATARATGEKKRADDEAERARVEQAVAKQALETSRQARLKAAALSRQAEQEARRADALLREAESTRRMAHADRLQDMAYDASLLVNLEAIRAAPTPDAQAGLLRRFVSHPHLTAFLPGHMWIATAVAFSHDGKRLASAGYDRTVVLWDVESRKVLATLKGHDGRVNCLTFSPDGKYLASAGDDKPIILWAADSGTLLGSLQGHDKTVRGVAFSPDGKRLASASDDKTVILWDIDSRRALATLDHVTEVRSVAFSPDGERLASAGSDNLIFLWDVSTRRDIAVLKGHGATVTGVAFSPDGKRLASASSDRTIMVWEIGTGSRLNTLTGHDGGVNGVAFSPDGEWLASASWDRTVIIWNLRTSKPGNTLRGHGDWVNAVAVSPDGRWMASAGNDGTILWDLATRKSLVAFKNESGVRGGGDHVVFSRDGTRLAVAFDDSVLLWDVVTRKALARLGHTSPVAAVSFSPDGRSLTLARADGTVELRDSETGKASVTLKGHSLPVNGVAFSPDGAWLVSASADATAVLWDVKTGAPMALESPKGGPLTSVAFSPDGKRIASGSNSGTVTLWDVDTRKVLGTSKGHGRRVTRVAFSPDSKRLTSASLDEAVVLWDVETLKWFRLDGHKSAVTGVAFSPDGKRIASGSYDKSVILWDVETRRVLATLSGLTAEVKGVAFSPDGQYLALSSADRTVSLWEVGSGRLAEEACRTASRNLTCAEWRNYIGTDTPYRKTCEALPGPLTCE
jgi:WD40 repeat protein